MGTKILVSLVLVCFVVFAVSVAQSEIRKLEPSKRPINHLVKGDCKDAPSYPEPDEILITVSGHDITVLHADAHYNCCFNITTEVVQADFVIDLYEHTSGMECDCLCYFDLSTTIYDLEAGTYTVNVYDADGEYVGGGTATIPEGQSYGPALK